MSTGRPREFQVVAAAADKLKHATGSDALVEYAPPAFKEEDEDLEIKLRGSSRTFLSVSSTPPVAPPAPAPVTSTR